MPADRMATQLLVYDEYVPSGTQVFTPATLNRTLGDFEKIGIHCLVDSQNAAGGIYVQIQHSGDGRNWLPKNAGNGEIGISAYPQPVRIGMIETLCNGDSPFAPKIPVYQAIARVMPGEDRVIDLATRSQDGFSQRARGGGGGPGSGGGSGGSTRRGPAINAAQVAQAQRLMLGLSSQQQRALAQIGLALLAQAGKRARGSGPKFRGKQVTSGHGIWRPDTGSPDWNAAIQGGSDPKSKPSTQSSDGPGLQDGPDSQGKQDPYPPADNPEQPAPDPNDPGQGGYGGDPSGGSGFGDPDPSMDPSFDYGSSGDPSQDGSGEDPYGGSGDGPAAEDPYGGGYDGPSDYANASGSSDDSGGSGEDPYADPSAGGSQDTGGTEIHPPANDDGFVPEDGGRLLTKNVQPDEPSDGPQTLSGRDPDDASQPNPVNGNLLGTADKVGGNDDPNAPLRGSTPNSDQWPPSPDQGPPNPSQWPALPAHQTPHDSGPTADEVDAFLERARQTAQDVWDTAKEQAKKAWDDARSVDGSSGTPPGQPKDMTKDPPPAMPQDPPAKPQDPSPWGGSPPPKSWADPQADGPGGAQSKGEGKSTKPKPPPRMQGGRGAPGGVKDLSGVVTATFRPGGAPPGNGGAGGAPPTKTGAGGAPVSSPDGGEGEGPGWTPGPGIDCVAIVASAAAAQGLVVPEFLRQIGSALAAGAEFAAGGASSVLGFCLAAPFLLERDSPDILFRKLSDVLADIDAGKYVPEFDYCKEMGSAELRDACCQEFCEAAGQKDSNIGKGIYPDFVGEIRCRDVCETYERPQGPGTLGPYGR